MCLREAAKLPCQLFVGGAGCTREQAEAMVDPLGRFLEQGLRFRQNGRYCFGLCPLGQTPGVDARAPLDRGRGLLKDPLNAALQEAHIRCQRCERRTLAVELGHLTC